MGQASAHRPIALVVEDDASQRVLVTTLLEESEMSVIQCESAEAAELVMSKIGRAVSLLFTDVKLAGNMTGLELADKGQGALSGDDGDHHVGARLRGHPEGHALPAEAVERAGYPDGGGEDAGERVSLKRRSKARRRFRCRPSLGCVLKSALQ